MRKAQFEQGLSLKNGNSDGDQDRLVGYLSTGSGKRALFASTLHREHRHGFTSMGASPLHVAGAFGSGM